MSTFQGQGGVSADTRKFGPREFVFRPSGVAEGNIYTDWALLYADLAATSGLRRVVIDDTDAYPSMVTMPGPGPYDFTDVELVGFQTEANPLGLGRPRLAFAAGVVITGLGSVRNLNLIGADTGVSNLQYTSSAPFSILYLDNCELQGDPGGGSTLILVTGASAHLILVCNLTTFSGGAAIKTVNVVSSGTLALVLRNNSRIESDVLESDGTASFGTLSIDSSSNPKLDGVPGGGSEQPGWLGSAPPPAVLNSDSERVSLDPGGMANVTATDVQGAIGELDGAIGGGGGTTAVTQTNAVFVSKAGNNGDTGLTKDDPKLTIAAALTVASGLTPTSANRVTVHVQDAGNYSEALTIPNYVTLDAPAAQITPGGVIMGLESSINIYKVTSGGTPIDCQGAGQCWVKAGWLQCTGISGGHGGVKVSHASAVVYVDVDYITGSREGVYIAVVGGKMRGRIGEITATGNGISAFGDAQFDLTVGRMTTSPGIVIGSTAICNLTIQDFDSATQVAINGTAVANVIASRVTGVTGTVNGTYNLVSAIISVPVTQSNVVYVSKAGLDANTGLTEEKPKLTIGSAITAASALTPTSGNRIEIRIQDAGRYVEVSTLPDYVSLIGPTASVIDTGGGATITMGLESTVRLAYLTGGNADALDFAAAGRGWVYINHIEILGISFSPACVHVTHASADAYIEVGRMTYHTRVGINMEAAGSLRGRVGLLTGTDFGLWMQAAAQVDLSIDTFVSIAGPSNHAIVLTTSGGVANLTIRDFNPVNQVNLAIGATVNLIASRVSGATGAVAGSYNLTVAGTTNAVVADGHQFEVVVLPGNTVNALFFAPYALTVTGVEVYAETKPASAGLYTFAVEDIDLSNNLLAAATFDMKSLTAATLTNRPLTGTTGDLDLAVGTRVRFRFVSDNADLTATGVYALLTYRRT